MASELRSQLETIIARFASDVEGRVEQWAGADAPGAFRAMELTVSEACRGLADAVTGLVLEHRLADRTFQAETSAAARAHGRYRCAGRKDVTVTLLGGSQVRVPVSYLKADRRGLAGRPRTKRGKGGTGLYPALAALGIWFGVTPAAAGEIVHQVADSDSVRAGRAALERRGLDLGHKQTLRIVNRFGERAVEQRQAWLQRARSDAPSTGPLRNKRVMVCTDGGRIRARCPIIRGRRRSASCHRRYEAPWREPKVMTIYVLRENGSIEDEFRPIYDGTLGDADALFDMLLGYLRALGAHEAKQLIFAGDGAHWIWNRIERLVQSIGIPRPRVVEVIDWYHAVQTLHEIAAERTAWTKATRDRWCRRARKALWKGDVHRVAELIDEIGVGRKAKHMRKHRGYFLRNVDRMQYASFKKRRVPVGSGCVESAVRRIVNMRMKGNGTFWLEENAESMLMLRSYLKAGRFDDLVNWSIASAAPWWRPDQHVPLHT